MSPITVEGLSLPLDIPAPVVTSPPAARGGESFQDHLRRAGSRDDARSTSSPPAEDRSSTSNAAATSKRQETSRGDDQAEVAAKDSSAAEAAEARKTQEAKTDSASKAEQGDEQVDAQAGKTDADGKQSSSDDEHAEKKDAEAIAAAAAAVAALKEAQTAAPDEIALSDEALDDAVADTTPVAPAEKPKPAGEERGAKTTAAQVDAVVGEAPHVDAAVQPSAETEQQIVAAPQESASATVVEQPQVENTKHAPKPAETTVNHVAAKEAAVAATEGATTAAAPPKGATAELQAKPSEEVGGKQQSDAVSTDGAAPVQANGATAAITAQVVEAVQAAAAAQSAEQLVDSSIKNDEDEKSRHADQKIGDAGHRERSATQADRAAAALETAQPATRRENSFAGEAAGGERAGSLSHAERARLVQRVTRAVTTAHERGGDLKIRLSPPELGSLKLQVKLTDGVLSARLEAETPQARQVIAESLPQLRERLAEQNIRVERFDVDLMNSGGGGLSNMPDRRQDGAHDGRPRSVGSTNAGRGSTTETTTRGSASNRRGDGGLDLLA